MCSEEDKLSLASATGDLSSQKSATYLLITKYAGVSTDTVDLLAGRMRARGALNSVRRRVRGQQVEGVRCEGGGYPAGARRPAGVNGWVGG